MAEGMKFTYHIFFGNLTSKFLFVLIISFFLYHFANCHNLPMEDLKVNL